MSKDLWKPSELYWHLFIFQVVRAFSSAPCGGTSPTSAEATRTAQLTSTIEINVSTVDSKSASKWGWKERVSYLNYDYVCIACICFSNVHAVMQKHLKMLNNNSEIYFYTMNLLNLSHHNINLSLWESSYPPLLQLYREAACPSRGSAACSGSASVPTLSAAPPTSPPTSPCCSEQSHTPQDTDRYLSTNIYLHILLISTISAFIYIHTTTTHNIYNLL